MEFGRWETIDGRREWNIIPSPSRERVRVRGGIIIRLKYLETLRFAQNDKESDAQGVVYMSF